MKLNLSKFSIRSFRLGFCIALSLLLAHFFQFLHPLWILITIIVVMFDQTTVGGTVYRAFLRIGATLFGAAVGSFFLLSFKNNILINDVVMIIGPMLCGLFFMDSKYSYIGLLGAATIVMVLAPNEEFNNFVIQGINLGLPFTRVISIFIGACLSILCIKYFFPHYASNSIDEHIIFSIITIRKLLNLILDESLMDEHKKHQIFTLEATLPNIYSKFERLAHESKFEKKYFNHNQMVKHLNRIYHLIYVLDDIFDKNNMMQPNIKNKLVEILGTFDSIIEQNKNNKVTICLNKIAPIDPQPLEQNSNIILANNFINKIILETDCLVAFLNSK